MNHPIPSHLTMTHPLHPHHDPPYPPHSTNPISPHHEPPHPTHSTNPTSPLHDPHHPTMTHSTSPIPLHPCHDPPHPTPLHPLHFTPPWSILYHHSMTWTSWPTLPHPSMMWGVMTDPTLPNHDPPHPLHDMDFIIHPTPEYFGSQISPFSWVTSQSLPFGRHILFKRHLIFLRYPFVKKLATQLFVGDWTFFKIQGLATRSGFVMDDWTLTG